ncbi:hypothetical protein ACFT8W_31075 [Streptomyces hygroscopicus]|uniref:hypothetical protein n=1 Tax=Streptomyces hygroscopicus TaxID=1912 RepID=UPI003645686E
MPAADADEVWQAIALHTSPGIAERRGTLCVLVREGVGLDFGGPLGAHHIEAVTDEQADALHHAYPRLEMARSLTDAIVAQAAKDPRNAPRYSIPGEFLRERGDSAKPDRSTPAVRLGGAADVPPIHDPVSAERNSSR